MKIVSVKTHEELVALGSALTWEGLKFDEECLKLIKSWMEDNGARLKDNAPVYITLGKDMNAAEGLTGSNAYPADLTIVSFKLEDIENVARLTLARFQTGGRWMDDILDNNRRREDSQL